MCQNNQPSHQSFPARLVQQPVCHVSLKCDSPDIVKPSELKYGQVRQNVADNNIPDFCKINIFYEYGHFTVQGKLQLTVCTRHLELLECFPSKSKLIAHYEGKNSGCVRKHFEFGIKWNLRQNQHSRCFLNHSLCCLYDWGDQHRASPQSGFTRFFLYSPHAWGEPTGSVAQCGERKSQPPLPASAEVLVLFLAEAFQEAVSLFSLFVWA